MANLALALKEVIHRIVQREVRAEMTKAKRSLAQYIREITQLKRQIQAVEKRLLQWQSLERTASSIPGPSAQTPTEPDASGKLRFSPRWVRAHRMRLGLSAEEYAKLLGVSRLTVYHWEKGKSRPRSAQLAALAALRKIGRREARARLQIRTEAPDSVPS